MTKKNTKDRKDTIIVFHDASSVGLEPLPESEYYVCTGVSVDNNGMKLVIIKEKKDMLMITDPKLVNATHKAETSRDSDRHILRYKESDLLKECNEATGDTKVFLQKCLRLLQQEVLGDPEVGIIHPKSKQPIWMRVG